MDERYGPRVFRDERIEVAIDHRARVLRHGRATVTRDCGKARIVPGGDQRCHQIIGLAAVRCDNAERQRAARLARGTALSLD